MVQSRKLALQKRTVAQENTKNDFLSSLQVLDFFFSFYFSFHVPFLFSLFHLHHFFPPESVYYFKKSNKKELLGCFPISKNTKVTPIKEVENGFEIQTNLRSFYLKASSKTEMEAWLHFFNKAIK